MAVPTHGGLGNLMPFFLVLLCDGDIRHIVKESVLYVTLNTNSFSGSSAHTEAVNSRLCMRQETISDIHVCTCMIILYYRSNSRNLEVNWQF